MLDTPQHPPDDPEVTRFWVSFFCILVIAEEAIGGAVGLYHALRYPNGGNPSLAAVLVFFSFALVSGIVLAVSRSWGAFPSLAVQAAQLVQIGTAGVFYHCLCGAEILIGYSSGDSGTILAGGLGLNTWLSFAAPAASYPNHDAVFNFVPNESVTGINIVALAALIFLLVARNADRKKRILSSAHPLS